MEIFIANQYDQFIIGDTDGNHGLAFLKAPLNLPKGGFEKVLINRKRFLVPGRSSLIKLSLRRTLVLPVRYSAYQKTETDMEVELLIKKLKVEMLNYKC